MLRILSVAIAGLVLQCVAVSQPNLNFKRISVNWPTVEAYFSVGCGGNPAYDMTAENFTLYENGEEVSDFTLWCPDPKVRCATSVSLIFDASGSMSGSGNAGARQAGHAFVDLMDGVVDEACLVYFSSTAWVEQKMTTDKAVLHAAVDSLPVLNMTAIWDGTYLGITEMISSGVNPCRAVIAMTDGGDGGSSRTVAEIIALANRHHIRVFTIGLGTGINATELQLIALLTGGRYYQTPNAGQLPAIYQEISTIIFQSFQECVITYERDCADGGMRTVDLQLKNFCGGADTKLKTYRAPLDTTTFTNVFLDLGDAECRGGTDVTVPLNLNTPVPDGQFNPLSFELSYDTLSMRFKQAQTTPGTLLEGMPITVTPIKGGVRIGTTDRKLLTGIGTLMELIFSTSNPEDTVRREVTAEEARFEYGCLRPLIDPGQIDITPSPTISGVSVICEGGSTLLSAPDGYSAYLWSTSDTSRSIVVSKAGDYTVTVSDSSGRHITLPVFTVTVEQPPAPSIFVYGSTVLCEGDSVVLGASGEFAAYLWTTNDTTRWIVARTPGAYAVTVWSAIGCEGTSSAIYVVVKPAPVKPVITLSDSVLSTDTAAFHQWYKDGRELPGETRQSLVIHELGAYQVKVTAENGCSAMSDPFNVLSTSVDHPPTVSEFQVYPDPSLGMVTVRLSMNKPARITLELTNLLGQSLLRFIEDAPTVDYIRQLDLTDVLPGVYILRVHAGGASWTRRLVRQ